MKSWTEERTDWRDAPMAYWVHREIDFPSWRDASVYDPPEPKPAGKNGYVFFCLEYRREILVFSSAQQLEEFIRIMSMNPLPTSKRLSGLRGSVAGPNSHWLSRLPA